MRVIFLRGSYWRGGDRGKIVDVSYIRNPLADHVCGWVEGGYGRSGVHVRTGGGCVVDIFASGGGSGGWVRGGGGEGAVSSRGGGGGGRIFAFALGSGEGPEGEVRDRAVH